MGSVVSQYILKRKSPSTEASCVVTISGIGNISASVYTSQIEGAKTVSYALNIPMSEKSVLGSGGKRAPIDVVIQRTVLESVFPEITGAFLGGVMMLIATIYSLASGLTSAGYALIGPSLAGIFGAVALWILNRETEKE